MSTTQIPAEPSPVQPAALAEQTPQTSQESQNINAADPFAAYGGHEITNPTLSADPFAAYGGRTIGDENPPAVSDPNESTMGKVWDWASKPLLNLHRENAGPIESGVENFASDLSAPLSLGLMIVSGGTSALAEGAGAEALEAASPEIARLVQPASRVVSRLMGAGFTGQQIYSVAKAVPAVSDAIKSGDYETAERLGTETILDGIAAGIGAKHAAGELLGKPEFSFPGDREAIGVHQAAIEKANLQAKNFHDANSELIANKPLDMAAQLYHEAGGDSSVLEKQRQDVMASPDLSDALKSKYSTIFQMAENLPDNVKALSDELRQQYAADWSRGQNLGMFNPEAEQPINYAGQHRYAPDDASESSLKPVGIKGTKSPDFTKGRVFPTIADALKAGFEPVDEGLAAARTRYIAEFGNAEGLRNAEDVLQRRKSATDSAPIAVDPSKVRTISGTDLDGKKVSNTKAIPLPDGVYHGTGASVTDITNLDAKFSRATATGGPGIYLTEDPKVAESYTANMPGAQVLRGTISPDIKLLDASKPLPDVILQGANLPKGTSYLDAVTAARNDTGLEEAVPAIKDLQKKIADQGFQGLNNLYTNRDVTMIFGNDILPRGSQYSDLVKAGVPSDKIIIAKNGNRYLDVSDYRPGPDKFNLWRIRGGKPVFDEEGERTPIFDRANLLIHPDYIDSVNRAFADTSWLRQSPILKGALKASTMAKKSSLSLSPFHWLTEGERGLQMGLNPAQIFNPPQIDPDGLAMSKGTKYGLTLLGDRSRNLMDEGVYSDASWTHKIPMLGTLLKQSEDKLFGDYIPRLKATAFDKVTSQLRKQQPEWSDAQVYTKASEVINGAFGGLNWRQMGVAMGSQDALRLMMLAPDFTGSQLLFAKAGLGSGGSVVWQSMAKMALYNAMVAQTINLLKNGKTDMSHPFSVQSSDGKYSYNVRSMPQDIYHALTDPRQFIANRLNPVITKPAIEFLSGKNEMGKTVTVGQQVADLIKNVVPISAQGFLFKRPDQTIVSQALHGTGVNRDVNKTRAMQMAIAKASARSTQGAVPSSQLAQHQLANSFIDPLRTGQISIAQVQQAILDGRISGEQGKRIVAEAKLSPLAGRVEYLPLNDALDVYQVATAQERLELLPVMRKKVEGFYKTAHTNETPQQLLFMRRKIEQILALPATQ